MQQQENFNPYAPPSADVDQGLLASFDAQELADRGTRLAAVLIDGLLLFAAYLPGLVAMFAVIGNPAMLRFARADEFTVFAIVGAMALLVLGFQIFQWYLVATTGQSLAKRWLGIKIVRMDGSPCGFVNGVILRSWVPALLFLIPFLGYVIVGLVNPLMIFGDERRCLHDHIASTRVIVAPKA